MYQLHLGFYLATGLRTLVFISFFFLAYNMSGQNYFLNGDAQAQAGNCYTITPNIGWQNGTVWYAEQLNLSEPFNLEFEMNFGSVNDNGADGMAFVLQTVGTNAIGVDGAGMGFMGFNPSFGIEFDTFNNTDMGDLASDHVAFLRNGIVDHNSVNNLAGPVQANGVSANIEDGQDHVVKITWNPQTQLIELYFDCVLRLSHQYNLVIGIFGGNTNVYWGFTGATGFYYNAQTVCLQDFYYSEMSDSTICVGQSVELAAPGNPQGSFVWLPTLGLDDPFSQTPFATPEVTTEYCYTYTDLCGNQFSNCHTLTVEQPPVIDVGSDAVFCEGQSLQINATCDQSNAILQWSTVNGTISGSSDELMLEVESSGIYVLAASSNVADCSSFDEIEVTEIPLPVFVADSPQLLCPGESVILDVGDNWAEVLWFDGSAGQAVEVAAQGFYEVTVTDNGCATNALFEVNEVDLPLINLGQDQLICEDDQATLVAVDGGTWNTGETTAVISVELPGEYIFLYTESGCTVSDSALVDVAGAPQFDLGAGFTICDGDTASLQIPFEGTWSTGEISNTIDVTTAGVYQVGVVQGPCVVTDAVEVALIEFPLVDLGDDAVYCSGAVYTIGAEDENVSDFIWSTGDETPTIDIQNSGEYAITVYNNCGDDSDTLNVYFDECDYSIYIPSAFTPDNDGLNDVFFVYATNLQRAELSVFNRWGVLVFSTTDISQPWTGDVESGSYFVPDGVYAYQLKFITDKGEAGETSGHITVIR